MTWPTALSGPAEPREPAGPGPSITCPRCGRTSCHPRDVQEGYCGACHDWTGFTLVSGGGRRWVLPGRDASGQPLTWEDAVTTAVALGFGGPERTP